MGGYNPEEFIDRWGGSGGCEIGSSQSFLNELCDLIGVERPDPPVPEVEANLYSFERRITYHHSDGTTTPGRVDLYKQGCFVLESKQGSAPHEIPDPVAKIVNRDLKRRQGTAIRNTPGWYVAIEKAKNQAENYVRNLPAAEGRPPFIIVVDVGHTIDLYSEFSMTGGVYVPFPDPQTHRITLEGLRNQDTRELLRLIWTDPLALDPTRRSAKVTREIAANLAELAKALEKSGNRPKAVAEFLMRCLFTMFAEDIGLLPKNGFTRLLTEVEDKPALFKPMAEDLWAQMKRGGFSSFLMEKILHFNGYLFAQAWALELEREHVLLLKQAAKADWRDVEPAIFGTLLERALDPEERHKLGAHYTPRAYVERLVLPTIMEPLRSEWDAVKAAAFTLAQKADDIEESIEPLSNGANGQPSSATLAKIRKLREEAVKLRKEATALPIAFHKRLCNVTVLDPACGSGNFLYVAMEQLKRLEGETLELIAQIGRIGHRQNPFEITSGRTIDPHLFLGIELNPRAAAITELVLWIGYLQWHFRTHGNTSPQEPIIRNFKNIECRDAVLAYDSVKHVLGDDNKPVTRWDGRTFKKSPVTGEDVPDESARVLVEQYINPRKAQWPKADFVVGNPPFLGISPMRQAMGDGYVETIRKVYSDLPGSCDYVLYWWNQAAHLAARGEIERFGFITTNSISQTFNRRLIERHLSAGKPVSILYAIPDHPWVDSADGAAVRIAVTVGAAGGHQGVLNTVVKETRGDQDEREVLLAQKRGRILADLTIGADVAGAVTLKAMAGLSCPGVKLHGSGFIVTPEQAKALGLGRVPGLERHIRLYRNGKDLTQTPRGVMVIDLFGLDIGEVQARFPEVYQWVLERVKPERDAKGDTKDGAGYAKYWWLFGKPRPQMRESFNNLSRFISTVETSKHRFFVFLDRSITPDNMLVNIALDDAYYLGVLSSRVHVSWALAAGGRLGLGNDPRYNKSRCFETFPFPDPDNGTQVRIRELGERLDSHRKRQQGLHPGLTMTGMYNVLEKLKAGQELNGKDREINQKGLVSVLREIHEELDAAVLAAYGWPEDLGDNEILERLAALNRERAAGEAGGNVRWLRPEYQAPGAKPMEPRSLTGMKVPAPAARERTAVQPWPGTLAEQARAVRRTMEAMAAPCSMEDIARAFVRAPRKKVDDLLQTLVGLGQAMMTDDGRFLAT